MIKLLYYQMQIFQETRTDVCKYPSDQWNPNPFHQYYVLGKKLGCGTFSEVYEAVQVISNEHFAVKISIIENSNQRMRSFLQRELDILKSLKHPNVVQLFEAFHVEGNQPDNSHIIYSVFELVSGGELMNRLHKITWFHESQARSIVTNLLSAIKYLHDKNIAHRYFYV